MWVHNEVHMRAKEFYERLREIVRMRPGTDEGVVRFNKRRKEAMQSAVGALDERALRRVLFRPMPDDLEEVLRARPALYPFLHNALRRAWETPESTQPLSLTAGELDTLDVALAAMGTAKAKALRERVRRVREILEARDGHAED